MSEPQHSRSGSTPGRQPDARPRLEASVDADVAVLGGGIVGITTALLLQEAGARVVLLEADRLARGVSGYTTAKVSSQHGLIYARLRSEFGADGARTYGAANEAALAWIADRVERDGIDCDFRRRASYAYVGAGADRSRRRARGRGRARGRAARVARRGDAAALPGRGRRALRRPGRVPRPQVPARARRRSSPDGCRSTSTPTRVAGRRRRALHRQDARRQRHRRPRRGRDALPVPRPLARVRARAPSSAPTRSLCRIAGEPPRGHVHQRRLADALDPRRAASTARSCCSSAARATRPARAATPRSATARSSASPASTGTCESVEYRWSSQDGTTIDGVPYVGPLTPRNEQVLMATGFAKWGMTGGTAAAMILSDRLLGRENPWAGLFNPNRVKPRAARQRSSRRTPRSACTSSATA